jgi:hypothetical protein
MPIQFFDLGMLLRSIDGGLQRAKLRNSIAVRAAAITHGGHSKPA